MIPYMLVVGPRDAEQSSVSVRDRLEGDLGAMPIDAGDQPAAAGDRERARCGRRTAGVRAWRRRRRGMSISA